MAKPAAAARPPVDFSSHTCAPLADFAIAPENPRTQRNADAVKSLADNLKAEGQLQPVICYRQGEKLMITVGGTRFTAAKQAGLAHLWFDCREKAAAVRAGLAEQEGRTPLHPADQAIAYKHELERISGTGELIDGVSGAAVKALANRLGKTPRFVEQRLKLAELHPPILKALREDKISVHAAEAWANADADRQEELWRKSGTTYRKVEELEARAIKDLIDKADLAEHDRLMKFVGKEAYKAAGGMIRQDLFTIDDEPAYKKDPKGFADRKLVQKLAREKLNAAKERTEKEGWGQVEITLARVSSWNLQKGAACKSKDAKSKHRVRISLTDAGKLQYERGLKLKGEKDTTTTNGGAGSSPAYGEQVTHQRVVNAAATIIGRNVAVNFDLAFSIVCAELATSVFNLHGIGPTEIGANPRQDRDDVSLTSDADERKDWERWQKRLLPRAKDLLAFMSALTKTDREELFAFLVGNCVDLDEWSPENPKRQIRLQLAALALVAGARPEEHWITTPEFVEALPDKQVKQICAAIGQRVPETMSKAAAGNIASAANTQGWLPPLLRELCGQAPPKAKAAPKKPAAKKARAKVPA